jgi:hypothetical protein
MIEALIALLITVLVVGIICWLVLWLIDSIPLPAPFGQIARVIVILIAVLIILFKALPLLGVSL